MITQQWIAIVVVVFGLAYAMDRWWYQPMKAREMRQEQREGERCYQAMGEILRERGNVAAEQTGGRLSGCGKYFGMSSTFG
ncbi:hypothetical protein [Pelagibius sp. Alg239-R121]|uniref:hypothetical protein n=1 Tax=Pelagibius sp. Alg239-R121 TaxID=2993448 RepID=UPI0024A67A25|nr:hypothetical protein [Pelagibius sp. Alg239-R121]